MRFAGHDSVRTNTVVAFILVRIMRLVQSLVNIMKRTDSALSWFDVKPLTGGRVSLAVILAVCADAVALVLGPLGWTFLDEIVDVLMMIATIWLLGFHFLLLPTFVVELIPVADTLPTWTGCVLAVIALRKRQEKISRESIIDVGGREDSQPPIA